MQKVLCFCGEKCFYYRKITEDKTDKSNVIICDVFKCNHTCSDKKLPCRFYKEIKIDNSPMSEKETFEEQDCQKKTGKCNSPKNALLEYIYLLQIGQENNIDCKNIYEKIWPLCEKLNIQPYKDGESLINFRKRIIYSTEKSKPNKFVIKECFFEEKEFPFLKKLELLDLNSKKKKQVKKKKEVINSTIILQKFIEEEKNTEPTKKSPILNLGEYSITDETENNDEEEDKDDQSEDNDEDDLDLEVIDDEIVDFEDFDDNYEQDYADE